MSGRSFAESSVDIFNSILRKRLERNRKNQGPCSGPGHCEAAFGRHFRLHRRQVDIVGPAAYTHVHVLVAFDDVGEDVLVVRAIGCVAIDEEIRMNFIIIPLSGKISVLKFIVWSAYKTGPGKNQILIDVRH